MLATIVIFLRLAIVPIFDDVMHFLLSASHNMLLPISSGVLCPPVTLSISSLFKL